VVVTATLTVAAFVPSRVTDWGETEQVDSEGAPVQVRVTLWLKPLAGETPSE